MIDVLVAVVALIAGTLLALALVRRRDGRRRPAPVGRILFPFTADALSPRALDAALRLAAAEHATLVPTYLAPVSLTLPLETPLPRQCGRAMPLLEAVEQRAARFGVPVDARIERGRDLRHALRETLAHDRYDRLVVAAADRRAAGFHPDDVAWLLEHAPGEIVILRPDEDAAAPDYPAGTAASASSTGTKGTPTASATGA